jgi:hypothetical protein
MGLSDFTNMADLGVAGDNYDERRASIRMSG